MSFGLVFPRATAMAMAKHAIQYWAPVNGSHVVSQCCCCLQDSHNHVRTINGFPCNDGAGPNEGAGTRDGAGTSETNSNVPGSASGSEEGAKTGTDAETSVGITALLV